MYLLWASQLLPSYD